MLDEIADCGELATVLVGCDRYLDVEVTFYGKDRLNHIQ